MTNLIRGLALLICALMLTSCSYLSSPAAMQGKNSTYMRARSIPPMRMPPGVSSSAFHTTYPVSDRNYSEEAKAISLVPPGLNN